MVKKICLKLKDQKGFTLLELLAVIVILGVIAAIAIPSITNVINSSKEKASVADALEIISAAKIYMADNPTDTSKDLVKTDLNAYLDRVKDDGFTVTVVYNTTQKTYTYYIKDHEALSIAALASKAAVIGTGTDKYVTEKDLSSWSN